MLFNIKKSDLARVLTARNDLTLLKTEEVINIFFAEMAEALAEGDKVETRGFGSFTMREYGAYTGRNPKPKEKIEGIIRDCRKSETALHRLPYFVKIACLFL